MFAAGQQAARISSSQDVGANDSSNIETGEDWLRIGKSFSNTECDKKAKRTANEPCDAILQVYKHQKSKHYHSEKKKNVHKKRHNDQATPVELRETRHLPKHKKKSKSKKRQRCQSLSSSNDDDNVQRATHGSRQNSRGKVRNRSRSWPRKLESEGITQFANDVVLYEQLSAEQDDHCLFEFDRIGDRDNQFYGSTYAHDRPLFRLGTQRNIFTGARVIQTQPRYSSTKHSEARQHLDRYFSLQARKSERDGRQKRLYLAYSEKRLTRAAFADQNCHSSQLDQAVTVMSRPHEMAFIPLDPVLDIDELTDTDTDAMFGDSPLLTEGQSVEQHLIECGRKLNAAVIASSHVINHWLDLMVFQEQTVYLHAKSKKISSAVKANILEKQAAIIAKALVYNPHSRELNRVKLNILLQAQANGEKSDVDLHERQLESLLSEDPANSDLWLKLLQSRQQHFGTFSMQSVRNLYARILTVLRAQNASDGKDTAATASSAASSGETETTRHIEQADDLLIVLLDFHFLMCVFEKKAGYVERSIAQVQALLDFSMMVDSRDSNESHSEMLRKFAVQWNDDDENVLRLGDRCKNMNVCSYGTLVKDPPDISIREFQDYIEQHHVTTVDQLNPPEVLRSKKHKQSLLSSSAIYQRLSWTKEASQVVDRTRESNEIDRSSTECAASDNLEMEPKQSSTLVYSNLHGCRISVDEADDTREYERILSELRGTETSRTRQFRFLKKEKMKHSLLVTTKLHVEDQRANYDPICEDDFYVQWLRREEVQMQVQWAPLQYSNPLHQGLIEQQPDRAILTEEMQPFLFHVPATHRWRLVAELLHLCGVDLRGEYSWETALPAANAIYADSRMDHELLVAPILSVLNRQTICSEPHALFLDPTNRKMLLENAHLNDIAVNEGVLRDPSKVAFVRRVFAQGLDLLDDRFVSNFKCLWIAFEAKVACACGDKGHDEAMSYARRLCQRLAQKSTNGDIDFDALYAYAKLELALGNERQVRRICENTLTSLKAYASTIASSARNIHRFTFLHARQEMWSSSSDHNSTCKHGDDRVLRCLYILWNVWQPAPSDCIQKETLSAAKKHQHWSRKYLQELLMSDQSTERNLVARYREELRFAVQHCVTSSSVNYERGKAMHKSHNESRCWAGYCLHNLALVVYAYNGFDAACREYREVLANVEHQTCSQGAWAWTWFLEFIQQHQLSGSFPTVAPRVWRASVNEAVEKYPFNELFLRLFVDSEMGNTISQVHRNYFVRVEKRWRRHYESPRLVEWLFTLLCEFCRIERAATIKNSADENFTRLTCCLFHYWGMDTTAVNRIRQIFESMVMQIHTRGSALCWGLYMRFEVALGKVDAAKKILYRGIATCAWSKMLYMDGIRVMRAYLSKDECQELLDLMEAKELHLCVDTEPLT